MEQTYNIQLEEYNTLKSSNVNASLTINLTGNNLLLPSDYVGATIDLYDEYINERKSSNKFRLTISISPYCSNVLFNPFTEIIKNEGSSNVKCLKNILVSAFPTNPKNLKIDSFISEHDLIIVPSPSPLIFIPIILLPPPKYVVSMSYSL